MNNPEPIKTNKGYGLKASYLSKIIISTLMFLVLFLPLRNFDSKILYVTYGPYSIAGFVSFAGLNKIFKNDSSKIQEYKDLFSKGKKIEFAKKDMRLLKISGAISWIIFSLVLFGIYLIICLIVDKVLIKTSIEESKISALLFLCSLTASIIVGIMFANYVISNNLQAPGWITSIFPGLPQLKQEEDVISQALYITAACAYFYIYVFGTLFHWITLNVYNMLRMFNAVSWKIVYEDKKGERHV